MTRDGDGVLFLNVGQKHLRNLVVSIYSLRKHYKGPVCVLDGDGETKKALGVDKRAGDIRFIPFDHERIAKKNSVYFAKTSMSQRTPFERTIYLDADTTIHGNIEKLYPDVPQVINWTQFSDWNTQKTSRIRSRIQNEGWPDLFPTQVAYQLAAPYPAINTGVIGFTRSSEPFMKAWRENTEKNVSFICDEICAQLLAYEYPHNIMDHTYNASPRFSVDGLGLLDIETSNVRIMHNHGNKGLKNGSKIVQAIWLQSYFEAKQQSFFGLDKWDETVYRGKKHPRNYLLPKEATPEMRVEHINSMYASFLETGKCPTE
jgi:hypothetical protein